TFDDIAKRKKIEEDLKVSEQNFRNSMDNSPLGIIIIGNVMKLPDGDRAEILYANKAILDIYGYNSIEELKAIPLKNRLTPESLVIINEKTKLWKTTMPSLEKYEQDIINTSGQVRHLEAIADQVSWDKQNRIQLIYNDVTERKKIEESLKSSEENFRNSMDNSPLGIIIIGNVMKLPDGDRAEILYANKAILDIYGYSSVEELKVIPLQNRLTPESLVLINEKTELWKTTMPSLEKYEQDIINTSGQVRHLEAIADQVPWDNQNRIQIIVNDVTERKRLEAEREEIQRQVQISSRLASVGEMAAGIAHEINNPLTGVVGFAELLIKRDLPEDIRKDVEMIAEGGRRVAEVVRRMLTFARQSKPYREEVDINSIIETTLEMRTSAMKVTDINVIDELDRELPKTISDGGQLQQVFLNIILNAEKEMSSAHDKGNLRVKTERVNGIIRISISDDGPGIAEENLEKIFDPFFTTREVGQGTGLGLSVSYGIINELDGTIHAESETGKGATFIIDLPIITEGEQPESDETGTENAPTGKPLSILLVDDEPLVNQYLNEALVNDGHEVKVITNGDEAIEEINSKDYDVILLDIKLPGKSGMEVYREVRKKSKSKLKKIIFITGDILGQDTESFLSRNKVPSITKPIDINLLRREIANIIT
ncbi:ATP-binding protein, partial [Chloroflexota bacterium]